MATQAKKKSRLVKALESHKSRKKSIPALQEEVIKDATSWLSKKYGLKKLPEEFAIILKTRWEINIREFIYFSVLLDKNSPLPPYKDFLTVAQKIGSDEIVKFNSELKEFKEKYDTSLIQTLEQARKGDKKSIFHLVEWDKTWVSMPFMTKIFAGRHFDGDQDFFRNLAGELRRLPKVKKKAKEERIVVLIRNIGRIWDLNKTETRKKLFDMLRETISEKEDVPLKLLEDYEYFCKYLKRHGLIPDTKM